jgi:hypothetical protein
MLGVAPEAQLGIYKVGQTLMPLDQCCYESSAALGTAPSCMQQQAGTREHRCLGVAPEAQLGDIQGGL